MDLGLPWFSYRASFGPSRAHFRSKNMGFFHENDFFGCEIDWPNQPTLIEKLGKVVFNLFDLFSII